MKRNNWLILLLFIKRAKAVIDKLVRNQPCQSTIVSKGIGSAVPTRRAPDCPSLQPSGARKAYFVPHKYVILSGIPEEVSA